nr:hypothetical protein GCM10020092_026190 [Actinoplanes digitatis]
MGSGHWSTDVYAAAAGYRAASGTSAFAYSDGGARKAHPALDPMNVGKRESRDSDEHPHSTPIAVLFDVTGSMGTVPRVLQTKLPQLLGLLTRKGYATDPHILFGAIGDATCDRVPLQIGQFESDNRMDEDLARIVLEGGGGGQRRESYELAMYFMARHTSLDSIAARGAPRLPVHHRRRDAVPAGQAEGGQAFHRRPARRADRDRGGAGRAAAQLRRLLHHADRG